MSAWCIGARRRPTHGGGGDADGGGDGIAIASGERDGGAGTTGAGQRMNHQHHGHLKSPSERDHRRELELKRGTRRARVCIGLLCVGSLALARGRPLYAPYIDVFGDANENATAVANLAPRRRRRRPWRRRARRRREKARESLDSFSGSAGALID